MEDIEQYRGEVFAAAYDLNNNSYDAEDAVQEAYIKYITKPPKVLTNVKGWLRKVARNACIDKLRRNNTIKMVANDHLSSIEDKRKPYKPYYDFDKKLSRKVRGLFKGMKPKFKAAVIAVDMKGMSYADAADELECTLGTLKSDLLRGRRFLRAKKEEV